MPEISIKDPTVHATIGAPANLLSKQPAVDLLKALKPGAVMEGPQQIGNLRPGGTDQVRRQPPAAVVPMQMVGAPYTAQQVDPNLKPSAPKPKAVLTLNMNDSGLRGLKGKERIAAQKKIIASAQKQLAREMDRLEGQEMKYVNPIRSQAEQGEEQGEEEQGEEETNKPGQKEMASNRTGPDSDDSATKRGAHEPPEGGPGSGDIEPRGKHKPTTDRDYPKRAGEAKGKEQFDKKQDKAADDSDDKAEEGTRTPPDQGRDVALPGTKFARVGSEEEQGEEEIVVRVSRHKEGTASKPGNPIMNPGVDWTGGGGNTDAKSAAMQVGTTGSREQGEEEEESIVYNGKVYRFEKLATEQEQGEQGEEEQGEEEQSEEGNPILKAAGMETAQGLANMLQLQGEAGQPIIAPELRDTMAWQASANSLPPEVKERYAAMAGVIQQTVDPEGKRYYGMEGQPVPNPKKAKVQAQERKIRQTVSVVGLPQMPQGVQGSSRASPADTAITELARLKKERPDLSLAEISRLAWLKTFPTTINRYRLRPAGS